MRIEVLRAIVVCCWVVSSFAPSFVTPPPGQEPEKHVQMMVMWRVPRLWGEAVAGADAIAVVRFLEREYEVKHDRTGHAYVVTRYTAEVLEFLKDDPRRAAFPRITIVRQGGVISEGGARVRYYDPNFRDYVLDGEYVVFLLWNPDVQGYSPFAGPVLTYQLDRAAQKVVCHAEVLEPHEADTPATFLTFLRAVLRR